MKREKKVVSEGKTTEKTTTKTSKTTEKTTVKKTVVLSYWRCNPSDWMDKTTKLWDDRGWSATFWALPKSQAVKRYKWYMALIGKPVPKRVKLEIE